MNALAPVFQDALRSAGPQAAQIEKLWWVFLAVCVVVALVVFGLLMHGLMRAPRVDEDAPADISGLSTHERRLHRGVIWGVSLSTVALVALLVASVHTVAAMAAQTMTDGVIAARMIKPRPIVAATAVPNTSGPSSSITTTRIRPLSGRMARALNMEAIMLPASLMPERKLKLRATINNTTNQATGGMVA